MPKKTNKRGKGALLESHPDKLTELQRLALEALKGELRVVRACGALDKLQGGLLQADKVGDIIDAIDAALLRDKRVEDSG